MEFDPQGRNILITGGTGSFGRAFVRVALETLNPRRLVVFSRDELKQHEMRVEGYDDPRLRYFIGDVRDPDRLRRAMYGIDVVVHAAALKQVPACEYNPIEAIMTNVMGARHVVDAALDTGVKRVIALSTDKAVAPTNLYGATKLCAEKLFAQSNTYAGGRETRFACVRYGNVVGSRGSVVPLFARQRESGEVTITDPRMTRFWLTVEQGVAFVINCLKRMQGGEVFVPKIPSMRINDLAEAVAPGCKTRTIGVRPGEKLHECLLSAEESARALDAGDMYVVPQERPFGKADTAIEGKPLPESFHYTSDSNDQWLRVEDLRELVSAMAPSAIA